MLLLEFGTLKKENGKLYKSNCFLILADVKNVYLLRKFICLLSVWMLIFSCKKEKPSKLPFEVNRNITCDDLYNTGYKRTFGVDVTMIGKIINDTIIHYQITEPIIDYEIHYNDFEENIPTKIDTIKKVTKYDKYLEMDALELNDSIYEFVWGKIKEQQKYVCDEGKISWRNFMLEIKKSETKNYRNTIDNTKYKVLDIENASNYNIDEFEVVNLIKKDTFHCSIYKQDNKYFFSSTMSIIKYD